MEHVSNASSGFEEWPRLVSDLPPPAEPLSHSGRVEGRVRARSQTHAAQ